MRLSISSEPASVWPAPEDVQQSDALLTVTCELVAYALLQVRLCTSDKQQLGHRISSGTTGLLCPKRCYARSSVLKYCQPAESAAKDVGLGKAVRAMRRGEKSLIEVEPPYGYGSKGNVLELLDP